MHYSQSPPLVEKEWLTGRRNFVWRALRAIGRPIRSAHRHTAHEAVDPLPGRERPAVDW